MSFTRKNDRIKYPNRMTEENRRKQKFAIWSYYEKKNSEGVKPPAKTTGKKGGKK